MSVLTERLLVRELKFSPQNTLTSLKFHLPSDSPRWDGIAPIRLRDIHVEFGGRLASWTPSDGGDDCDLHAVIDPEGDITLSCAGECPPAYPVCSLTQVVIGEQIHIVCLCKAESEN